MTDILVPVNAALTETPEYANLGAAGFVKSILPVYSMSESVAGIVIVPWLKTAFEIRSVVAKTISNFKI